ncbi:osmoprotectant transport system ATP-binding protein [Saccharopolyspora shandongensis]|uniref:ABC-type quaternary amine transporter n=1 Tax=Saccharopolyspora shandongensis TaxID=418495 RepID=A0A1H2S7S3_9PSEU|nr:ATP-binding cassette domain-containing protein [Saccharopolyspora shandongensis]SDW27580.1 osmoprotectant transport system ATP-binding protein [Saccharopolyspora shandongensis]
MADDNNTPAGGHGVEICLDEVSKRYPGQKLSAVESVTMTIPAGETVVLVGPSGSGKTTTMRMINRLIEPTSGKITIGGQDVLGLDPDKLRREIGYSIQQAGLFPHLTVGENVGVVPGLVGWDKKRIRERVDEMLDLVNLDPGEFRDRYPRQLSGGQQQRVGVARALAANPPVLLMDEPFGAVDPITRGVLQDELMRLQAELGKTIVFVTHDFDEAVKLGDRIAVLGERSKILQYDTPEAILANPADDTVAGFVGAGAALKQLTLRRVREIEVGQVPTATIDESPAVLKERLGTRRGAIGLVLDKRNRPLRWATAREAGAVSRLDRAGRPVEDSVALASTLQDALEAILTDDDGVAVVTGSRGEYVGVVDIDTVMNTIKALREEHAEDEPTEDQS